MYRHIVKATSLIGSASLLKVLLGIAKNKLFALWLGAPGIGLISILQNMVSFGRVLFSLGIQTSGTQAIAAKDQEPSKQKSIIKTLLLIAGINGGLAMVLFWQLGHYLSIWLFGSPEYSHQIMWSGVGVLFSILATTLLAILQGLRKIKLLSLITILSSAFGTLLSVFLVWLVRENGIVAVVIIPPILTGLFASFFLTKLLSKSEQRPTAPTLPLKRQGAPAGSLVKNGIPYMATGLVVIGTQLATKSLISTQLGLTQTGYFQAAWTVSMTYIGFLLSAMGTDYLPHLSQAVKTKAYARSLINKQLTIALLLSGPVILTLIGFSDWIVELMYSQEFKPASGLLIWQAYGDFFKVASWPLTFILIATKKSLSFLLVEITWNALYIIILITLLPVLGLESAGLAFLCAYLFYWLLSTYLANRVVSFKISKMNARLLLSWLVFGFSLIVAKKVFHLSSYAIPLALTVISVTISASLMYRVLTNEGTNNRNHD